MGKSRIGRRFDQTVWWLRKHHAPKSGLAVQVRTVDRLTVDDARCWGAVQFTPGHGWIIRILRSQTVSHAVETLVHEWAHCLQDEIEHAEDTHYSHHSDVWGQIYARLYRELHEFENN